jgi:hypothetical protein
MTSEILGVGASPAVPAASAPAADAADHGLSFHDVLSALNPLQYLPVVGTIYRAVTGDVIPEGLRRLGSMLVSGLLGGPIGLGINIATTLAEKASGIDPEKIVAGQINSPAAVPTVPATPPEAAPAKAVATSGACDPPGSRARQGRRDVGTINPSTARGLRRHLRRVRNPQAWHDRGRRRA